MFFKTKLEYEVMVIFFPYHPQTRSREHLTKFLKSIWHDPSDKVLIENAVRRVTESGVYYQRGRVLIRCKEKGVKVLQKMEDKKQIMILNINRLNS